MGAEFHSEAAAAESGAADQEDLQGSLRYEHRPPATASSAVIRQNAPAAPRAVQPRNSAPRPEPRRDHADQKRPAHPHQQPPRPQPHQARHLEKKTSNPIWETVNKLTEEKLKQQVDQAVKPKNEPAKPQAAQEGRLKPGDKVQF
jgi:hypothetical protein